MSIKSVLSASMLMLSMFSADAFAAKIALMAGTHDMEFGNNRNSPNVGIDGLGHVYTKFSNSIFNWSSVLSSGFDAIVIEENGGTNATSVAIANYITNGGRVIVAGYTGVNGNSSSCTGSNSLYGALFGVPYSTQCSYIDGNNSGIYSATAAILGTTFAGGPSGLSGPSSVHAITSTLAANSTVFYKSNTYGAQVVRTTLGLGDYFHIGFDYCCVIGASQEADYYSVLNRAITFNSSPASVPEPATLGLFGLGLLALRRLRKN